MEGMNWAAILLGYLAVFAFAATSLVALGLLVAGRARAARLLFAAGLLAGTLVLAAATLSFFEPQHRHEAPEVLIVVTAVSLALAGAGQFAAAVRGRAYAAALGCAAAALALTASPLFGWGWRAEALLGALGLRLAEPGFPILVPVGLLPAAVSLVIGLLPPWGVGHGGYEPARR